MNNSQQCLYCFGQYRVYRKDMELIGVTVEMKYRFREYVEKTGIDWIESALEEEV